MSDESGFTGVTTVVAAALALVVFVTMVDLIVAGYTRGAARTAVAEAARAAARSDDPAAACPARAAAVLDGLLGAAARRGITVRCAASDPVTVRVDAEVVVVPWWPGLPVWTTTVGAVARREVLP